MLFLLFHLLYLSWLIDRISFFPTSDLIQLLHVVRTSDPQYNENCFSYSPLVLRTTDLKIQVMFLNTKYAEKVSLLTQNTLKGYVSLPNIYWKVMSPKQK